MVSLKHKKYLVPIAVAVTIILLVLLFFRLMQGVGQRRMDRAEAIGLAYARERCHKGDYATYICNNLESSITGPYGFAGSSSYIVYVDHDDLKLFNASMIILEPNLEVAEYIQADKEE